MAVVVHTFSALGITQDEAVRDCMADLNMWLTANPQAVLSALEPVCVYDVDHKVFHSTILVSADR